MSTTPLNRSNRNRRTKSSCSLPRPRPIRQATPPTAGIAGSRIRYRTSTSPASGLWAFPPGSAGIADTRYARRAGNARGRNTSGPSTPGCANAAATSGEPPPGCEGRATDWTTANRIRNTWSRLYGVRYAGNPGVSATTVNVGHIAYQRRTGTCRRCAGPVHAAPADGSPAACRPGHEAGDAVHRLDSIKT